MALTDESVIDKIEVYEDGSIGVRTATRVFRDGVRIAETYHRELLPPGAPLTSAHAKVSAVAGAVWTPDVVSAHASNMADHRR